MTLGPKRKGVVPSRAEAGGAPVLGQAVGTPGHRQSSCRTPCLQHVEEGLALTKRLSYTHIKCINTAQVNAPKI